MRIATAIALSVLITSSSATADDEAKRKYCFEIGGLFAMVSEYRDSGFSPQSVLAAWNQRRSPEQAVTEKKMKKIINTVYFDPGFTYAGGIALQTQMIDSCMRGWKPKYEPLK